MGKKRKSEANTVVDENVETKKIKKKVKSSDETSIRTNEDHTGATSSKVDQKTSMPKKIIFVNDEPQEVLVKQDTTAIEQVRNKKVTHKRNNETENDILREEDVKDEDIDKFCDELDEEDNKQYEYWIKLIEANLSSNKKKAK